MKLLDKIHDHLTSWGFLYVIFPAIMLGILGFNYEAFKVFTSSGITMALIGVPLMAYILIYDFFRKRRKKNV
jgi:hypothetical protein